MVDQNTTRASGMTGAQEEAREAAADFDAPLDESLPGDDPRDRHNRPGFSRMRTEWNGPDRTTIQRVHGVVEERILANFGEAYVLMNEIYSIVRTQERNPDDTPRFDAHGWPVWKHNASGIGYEEDFTRLTLKQREHLLFKITTDLFNWEQAAAEAWAEAMYAKAIWEESFAVGFDAPVKGTVDDRRAAANRASSDDRFFAVFVSAYSRRADACVRAMDRLGQRLKDVITTR